MKTFNTPLLAFIATVLLLAVAWQSSVAATLSGVVRDEQRQPLAAVTVSIPALKRGMITEDDGKFTFDRIPNGTYTLQFSLIGYAVETRQVRAGVEKEPLSVMLRISPLDAPSVTVTAGPQPTDALTTPQAVSVLQGRQLDQNRGEAVMQSIKNTPGVSLYTTGSGIAKPVIRGLTSQRVLVVVDGIRQEGQQWGDEHGPEIDPLDVDKIEVVRGPGSVLYGSDALGGVVNILRPETPSVSSGAPLLEGEVLFNGFTNNRQGAGALSLSGAKGSVGYRGNISLRNANDTRTPVGKLFNSGEGERNGSFLIGATGEWGSVAVDFGHFGQRLEIHEDPAEDPTATPFQRIKHDKVHLHANFPVHLFRLEMNGSYQWDDRREFETAAATAPVLNLRLNTASLDVKAHHQPVGPVYGTVGFAVVRQTNASLATEKLIPDYNLTNMAGFLFEEIKIGTVNLSAGIRGDTRTMEVKTSPVLGVTAQTRSYNALSATSGLTWRIAEPLAVTVSVGKGWRAPTAFELFVDGVHEGSVRYEIGDAALKSEASLNTESSLRYASPRFQGEATVFRNRLNRYIYNSPTNQIDLASGFPIYLNKQANATLVGAEFSFQAQVAQWLILSGGVNLIHGSNEAANTPLPLMPASNGHVGARLTVPVWVGLHNPYFSVETRVVTAQKRIEVFETPTPGYTLVDLEIGWEIPLGPTRRITVDLAVKNLLDRAYTDHLSRYKVYALDPGRNLSLKLAVPFTLAK